MANEMDYIEEEEQLNESFAQAEETECIDEVAPKNPGIVELLTDVGLVAAGAIGVKVVEAVWNSTPVQGVKTKVQDVWESHCAKQEEKKAERQCKKLAKKEASEAKRAAKEESKKKAANS